MRYSRILQLVACAAVLLTSPVFSGESVVPGRVVVQIDANDQLQKVLNDLGGRVIDSIPGTKSYLIGFDKSTSAIGVARMLKGRVGIQLTHPDLRCQLPEVNQISIGFPDENDPKLNAGISPPSFYGQPGLYATGIDSAQTLYSGTGIVVAILDNGIDLTHPLFADGNLVAGYDFVNEDADPSEMSGALLSHGTFVAGLVRLTAPGATLMPIRVFDGDGYGSEYDIIQGIYWAINHGADVINMSFGTSSPSTTFETAIYDAYAAGIVLLASVGNSGSADLLYPAAYPEVIAVSAIDTLEYLAAFSCYGHHIDVSAPGVGVYSCFAGEHPWGTWSGTSFSVALVSGVAALSQEAHATISPAELELLLKGTARTQLNWGNVTIPDIRYGSGVVNALAAVQQAGQSAQAGDVNSSGLRDITDLTLLVNYVNREKGAANQSRAASLVSFNARTADLTGDGAVNVADVKAMVRYMFQGGGMQLSGAH